ncbi:hypothetical protein BDY21DRAFT_348079 [Lineolata rhizophorae]|uniref:Uncharacterized protein n=1 Tax=Lineolata rhizophorae TaxID=578093 RepID=A0A6A6NXF6_9PEZI|nr:hypothetical protein BDY21DRAFT_348079 [Lineolata rhizophorae]
MDTIASLPEAARVINTHLWDVRRRYDSAWSFLDTVAQAGHCAGDVNYGAVAEEARLMPPMGKVLLFCESGNERCCTVAAGWLMQHVADVDFTRAMQIVASQRYCANFDDATRNMLRSFWDIIKARRAVLGEMVVKEWGQRLQEGGVDEGGEVKMELGVEPGHAVKSTKDGKPSAPVQKRKAHQTMDDQDMADDDLARFQDRNLNFEEDADMPFS